MPRLPTGCRQVRTHAARQPGQPPSDRSRRNCGAAAHHAWFRKPGARARTGRTVKARMRVAEALGRAVAQLGVTDFFGLVGSGNFHLTNALQASGARFVAARHETGAVTMADAYARASGRLGVCTVHQGPGVTNTLTGLTESAKSRTPLLLLAAEATAPLSNFFIDEEGVAKVAGAVHRRLSSPAAAVKEIADAARIAVGERRTVLISLPLEVQAGE